MFKPIIASKLSPASRANLCRAALVAALGAVAGTAWADQDVMSSDGQWKLHAKMPDALTVKKSAEALIDVTPAAGGKGCPALGSVVFEMPAHGHGGDMAPQSMTMDGCKFHVTDLSASMGGSWRLRLVLKNGDKSSNADFTVPAK
jgi:hypothetical protein